MVQEILGQPRSWRRPLIYFEMLAFVPLRLVPHAFLGYRVLTSPSQFTNKVRNFPPSDLPSEAQTYSLRICLSARMPLKLVNACQKMATDVGLSKLYMQTILSCIVLTLL